MLVTKSTGEPRVTITMTPGEAATLRACIISVGTIGWPSMCDLSKQLEKVIAPVETCEVNIGGNINNKCKREAKHRWKVTCKNDHLRTRNYCDYHGSTREAAELLVCRPCKIDGLGHVYVVGVAKVKL